MQTVIEVKNPNECPFREKVLDTYKCKIQNFNYGIRNCDLDFVKPEGCPLAHKDIIVR